MKITIPLRVISEANRASHEHWRRRWARGKSQREIVAAHWRAAGWPTRNEQRLVIALTRIAPRRLDDDNLVSSFKAVRDEVAKQIGVDDRNPRLQWAYSQRKGAAKQYAIEISVVPA